MKLPANFPSLSCLTAIGMVAAVLALSPATTGHAYAQQANKTNEAAPEPTLLPPAYDDEMMRLAEILGSLHYLRELCGAKEGQLWRDQMQEMIDKEDPTPERRARLIARFNRGFRGFREIYRECTPAAAEAANRYLRQGTHIAAEIPNRYGR